MGNVLPFPQTAEAIRHYNSDLDAAGLLSLMLIDRDGKPQPPNVERFDKLDQTPLPERSPELLLLLLMFGSLPSKKREDLKRSIRVLAYGARAAPEAVQLHRLLHGGR